MRVCTQVNDLMFWREKGVPFFHVQRNGEPEYAWERIEDPNRVVAVVLEELESSRQEVRQLREQCADLGRRILSMELGA